MTRMNVWIGVLLVSVLINGVLIGMVLQNQFSDTPNHSHEEFEDARHQRFNPRAFVAALPPDHADRARARWRVNREAMREQFSAMQDARAQVIVALRQEPFDPDFMLESLNQVRATRADLEVRMEQSFIEILSQLPADERERVFMAGLQGHRERHRHHERHAECHEGGHAGHPHHSRDAPLSEGDEGTRTIPRERP